MKSIELIKLSDTGLELPASAKNHAAVLLPKYDRIFTARVINAKAKPQRKLEADCKAVTCAGPGQWDLPELDELELIVDRSRYGPVFNPEYFLDIPLSWIWTKTRAAWAPESAAWSVNAGYGLVYYGVHDGGGFALAVRRVGQ